MYEDAIFSPLLWGNPASHFGTQNDAVYVALVRFKRTLYWANAITRSLTHTMHFPPAQAEIYDGPRSEWLADILRRLPYLQSLVVAHIPFFDYAALSSLVRLSQPNPGRGSQLSTYQLRLLDASNCYNLTPQSLAAALPLFPGLAYLDFSGTTSARYHEVLLALSSLPALQILKMQRLWMTDDDLAILVRAVSRRLCSLDIRNNRITDRGVAMLIQDAIRSHAQVANAQDSSPRLSTKIERVLASEKHDEHIRKRLTSGFVSNIGIEAESGQGITHLFAAGNAITSAGTSGLLRCKQLRVLDSGTIVTEKMQTHHPKYELPPELVSLPGAESLIPIIESEADNLTYLRINHAVVTRTFSLKEAKTFEVEDTSSMAMPRGVTELESTAIPPRELHGEHVNEVTGSIPIYAELEGSPVEVQGPNVPMETTDARTGHIASRPEDAPLPVSAISPALDSTGGLFSPVSPMSLTQPTHRPNGMNSDHLTVPGSSSLPEVAIQDGIEVDQQPEQHRHHQRKRTYSGVLNDHEARTHYRQSEEHNLLAATMKQIRTLVLTDVPTRSRTANVAGNIIKFIESCAEEERWAALKASVGYQLPPGPDRRSAERQYAQTIFPFRKLVLEMAAERPMKPQGSGSWAGRRNGESQSSSTLSSTLDPDCETYLNAAKDDFSFFGSEECGQPDADMAARIPIAAFREKMTIDFDTSIGHRSGKRKDSAVQEQSYDVLAEISRFRRTKKAEFEAAVAAGREHVEGHWTGVIEVIRPRT